MTLAPPSTGEDQPEGTRKGVSLHLGGLAAGTHVLSPRGMVPVDEVKAGDKLVTRERGMQAVAFATQRLLKSGDVISIRPEALGGEDGDPSLFVAPSQRVLLRDWRAKAMFGRGQALVAARKLVDGELVKRQKVRNLRLYSLHFENELVLYAGGLELGSASPVTAFLQS